MDVLAYLSLGLNAITIIAVLVLAFWGKSATERGDAMSTQRNAAKDDASAKTLEAERAKFDLAQSTIALAAERQRATALEEYVKNDAQVTDDTTPLAPDDVAGRLLRHSRGMSKLSDVSSPARPGASPGPVAAGAVSPTPAAVKP